MSTLQASVVLSTASILFKGLVGELGIPQKVATVCCDTLILFA